MLWTNPGHTSFAVPQLADGRYSDVKDTVLPADFLADAVHLLTRPAHGLWVPHVRHGKAGGLLHLGEESGGNAGALRVGGVHTGIVPRCDARSRPRRIEQAAFQRTITGIT